MAQKPSIPKGTRDFTPSEVSKRNYIFDLVKKHFQTFGYQPIETPSFENSDTLLGKYGEEGDRLIFKILESGEFLNQLDFKGYYLDHLTSNISKITTFLHNLRKAVLDVNLFLLEKYFNQLDFLDFEEIDDKIQLKSNLKIRFIESLDKSFASSDFSESSLEYSEDQINYDSLIEDYLEYFQTLIMIGDIFNWIKNNRTKYSEGIGSFATFLFERYYDKKNNLIESKNSNISRRISEKALRYDLTVPFARYVVMHQNELSFPFKRYQIQPVWRADRPQKGRFREFFQCDADVVGSDSLLQEVELVQLYDTVFSDLNLNGVTIKMNNRKILSGIAEVIGAKHQLIDFTVALDKLDKIGEEGVKKEMLSKGISEVAIEKAAPLFSLKGSNAEQLDNLAELLKNSEEGSKGVAELRFIFETISSLGLQSAQLTIDVTLARGLNYYTGAIFEVAAPEGVAMGSIGGGGRYDDLTGIFGLKDVSGVGISFGLDRIYLVLEELNLFPEAIDQSLEVLCLNFGTKEGLAALKLTTVLRKAGLKADLYPTDAKIQKQFKYANNRKVPYVILLGEQELNDGSFVVKHMESGEQKTYALKAVQNFIDSL